MQFAFNPTPATGNSAFGAGTFGGVNIAPAAAANPELNVITGLKPELAKQCLTKYDNDYRTALCSVVQTAAKLPKDCFAQPDALTKNMTDINKTLAETYEMVRKEKEGGKSEADSWAALRKSNWKKSGATGFGAAPAPAATEEKKPEKKEIPTKKIPKATHFTGPLFEMPEFWEVEVEGRCTLLNLDRGFLAKNKDVLRARLMKWVDKCGAFHRDAPVQYFEILDRDQETTRVIIKDVERTFFGAPHREKMINFLFSAWQELGSYGQPMSFLAGLCMLVLDEQETIAVLRRVAKEYIPKHWAHEAVGFATNAWLIESIMQKRFPDVAKHFMAINFWPDTYMQKIISALCIHVLPFDLMFTFLDAFMEQGFVFLVKFELSIIEHFRARLLAMHSENINEAYELMRLDYHNVQASEAGKILSRAIAMPDHKDFEDLDLQRMLVYDEKVKPRLAAAPKEPEFEPCESCEKAIPKLWCDECEYALCQSCHDAPPKDSTHKKSHDVEPY